MGSPKIAEFLRFVAIGASARACYLGRVISEATPLVLGSASPRRREILERAGVPLSVVPVNVDEAVRQGETPGAYLQRVVADKLAASVRGLSAADGAAVLVADTSVVLDAEILGKPASVDEAERMVARLVGRGHEVMTRYAVMPLRDAAGPLERTVVTRVFMRTASPAKVRRYAQTGEGLDKAGGYAVQGLGAELVTRIEGSYTNVVGLPLAELMMDLEAAGLIAEP